MSNTGLEQIVASVVPTPAPFPAIKWEKVFPQVFKRGGEIRQPKGAYKSKATMSANMRKVSSIALSHESGIYAEPELRIIVPGGAIVIFGNALDEFMALEENGLLDLVGAGWNVQYV